MVFHREWTDFLLRPSFHVRLKFQKDQSLNQQTFVFGNSCLHDHCNPPQCAHLKYLRRVDISLRTYLKLIQTNQSFKLVFSPQLDVDKINDFSANSSPIFNAMGLGYHRKPTLPRPMGSIQSWACHIRYVQNKTS